VPEKFNRRTGFAPPPSRRPSNLPLHPALPAEPSGWLVWQLLDSGFPTGGFAHSSGLEAAWQLGEVRGRDELVSFLNASLEQLGHAGLPLMLAAFAQPEKLPAWDDLCEAFTLNHVANRASRAQGRAFLTAVERIFPPAHPRPGAEPELSCAHFAPVFGASLRRLLVPRDTAGRMFFFNHLRGVLAAAVRLNLVGPMEAQMLLRRLLPQAEVVWQACESLTPDDLTQTAPLLDLWQGTQDRLYSRLFQS
jgi:urease accessory protein